MPGTEEKRRFCIQCGQQVGSSKFCPYCGTPIKQISDEAAPPIEVREPSEKKPKKARALKIVLCCLGGLILLILLAALALYQAFWPGEFTDRQLQEIQSNAENRIATVLEMLDYDDDVEAEVVIRSSVSKSRCNEHIVCLRRYYGIDFNLTTNGNLSDMDEAAILVCMEYFFGNTFDNSKVFPDDPFSSSEDLSASWDFHYPSTLGRRETIMGVAIPATEYSWLAYSHFTIDGAECSAYEDKVTISGAGRYVSYTPTEVMDYALWRVGYLQSATEDEYISTQSAAPSSQAPASSELSLPYVIRATAEVPIYSGPGTNYSYTGSLPLGAYTITEESAGQGATLWGKLKSGIGWIALDYVQLT